LFLDERLNFHHLIDKALQLEKEIEGTTNRKRKLEDQDQGKYSSLSYPMPQTDDQCYLEDQSQDQDQDEPLLSNLQKQCQPPSIEDQAKSTRRSTKAKGACYFCKDDGHLISQCPKKRLHRKQKKAPSEDPIDNNLNTSVSVIHEYVDSWLSTVRVEGTKK
jgi:hypothetical protein